MDYAGKHFHIKRNLLIMKTEVDMQKWWSAVSVATKETVSGKSYPECSTWWNSLTLEEKIAASEASGVVRRPRNKTKSFT
jgi:hypothetical protein